LYDSRVELRQLEAFVAVASELHFGRAADKLLIGQPTLSELIRRLEREFGAPLFTRTTRRVALTSAGAELLGRSKVILDDVASATAAVKRVAQGDAGTVRVGITPPVAPVLGPHLLALFAAEAALVDVVLERMWLPTLSDAVARGTVDVAISCAVIAEQENVLSEVFCAEPLLVGLRPGHRLSGQTTVTLADLAYDVLGATRENLFPAWALCQRQLLAASGIAPPTLALDDTDLAATRWLDQPGPDWIMLTPSLAGGHTDTVVRPTDQLVPFTLQWAPSRAQTAAVARFVRMALTAEPPPGWRTQPGHLHHVPG
jgi:DNA-binding transcriptional LysR family regulator